MNTEKKTGICITRHKKAGKSYSKKSINKDNNDR